MQAKWEVPKQRAEIFQEYSLYTGGFVNTISAGHALVKGRRRAPHDHKPPKILLYSHDTFGLGNIRRTLLLATHLREEFADAAILIVTGSPVIHAFRIPAGIDYIKLPSLDRVEAETYEPRFLNHWSGGLQQTRRAILKNAILGFNPDLMIVDKRPSGIDGELLDTLAELRCGKGATRLILGVRDILDAPERTRVALEKAHSFDIIERYYDEVWIYGVSDIFDHVHEYQYPAPVAQKTFYCGYLQRPTLMASRDDGPPHVLVTTGGGGDGTQLIEAYLEGLLDLPRRTSIRSTVIFGPEMPVQQRHALLARYNSLTDVAFHEFAPDLTPFYATADLVLAMAGYNTVCELLSFGRRAILVPRAEPVREQLIRARRFSELGYFEYIEPDQLSPKLLLSSVLSALHAKPAQMPSIDLGGLTRIGGRVHALLAEKP